MIEDLKADSARWELERRQLARNSQGNSSRDSNGFPRSSNSPVAQYLNSETRYSRTQSSSANPQMDYEYDQQPQQPRYPGSGASDYRGMSNNYPQQQQAGGYGQPAGYYPPGPVSQYPMPGAPQFGAQPAVPNPYASQGEPYTVGGHSRANPPMPAGYADIYNQGNPSGAQQRMAPPIPAIPPTYPASTQSPQTGYPPTTQAANPANSYYPQVPVHAGAGPATSYAQAQTQDPRYGRGAYNDTTPSPPPQSSDYVASPASSAAPSNFGPASAAQPYEEPSSVPRTTAPSSGSQMANAGTTSSNSRQQSDSRHNDRHADRRHRPAHRS